MKTLLLLTVTINHLKVFCWCKQLCPGYLGLGRFFKLALSLPRLGLPGHDCYIFKWGVHGCDSFHFLIALSYYALSGSGPSSGPKNIYLYYMTMIMKVKHYIIFNLIGVNIVLIGVNIRLIN